MCSRGPLLDERRDSAHVTYHSLLMRRRPALLHDLGALVAWVRLVRRIHPHVISVGTPKAGLLGALAGALNRVPSRVLHQRGLVLETSRGFGRRILWATEKLSMVASTRVLAVSQSLAKVIVENGLASESKVVVLGAGSSNGVDTEEFAPDRFESSEISELRRQLEMTEDRVIVGYVGRMTADKGFPVLAEALRLLDTDRPVSLLSLGPIEDDESDKSLADIRRTNVRVIAPGEVKDPAIYYQLMDLLCLPTYREGLPNVALEAAASAIPVVTTDATGAVDAVVDGETGIIVPMGDPVGLAAALRTIIEDVALRERLGRQGQAWVRRAFERRDVWARLSAFYSELGSEGR